MLNRLTDLFVELIMNRSTKFVQLNRKNYDKTTAENRATSHNHKPIEFHTKI